jgi:ABC-type nitrate/sulfonate/bicarbonate transport system permease component
VSAPEASGAVAAGGGAPPAAAARGRGAPAASLAAEAGRALLANLPAAACLGVLLVAWQVAVTALEVSDFILPAPLAILQVTVRFFPQLVRHTWTTTSEILLGFAIGNAVAVLMAVAIVNSRLVERTLYPLIIASQTIPKVAVAPLFLIWFGSGLTPKVVITAIVCFFPTVVNTVQGLRAADERAIDLLRLVAASRRQVFVKLQFPSALPYFFAGLKISVALAVIGAIIGEWVGANSGLGYLIMYSTQTLRTDLMFAALLVVSALGIALYLVAVLLERLFSWRASSAPIGGL